jgi:hypothetical protein
MEIWKFITGFKIKANSHYTGPDKCSPRSSKPLDYLSFKYHAPFGPRSVCVVFVLQVFSKTLRIKLFPHQTFRIPDYINSSFHHLIICKVKVQVKQSHYKPWQAMRFPGVWGSKILRQSAHEGGKVISPTLRAPLPPENISDPHFC